MLLRYTVENHLSVAEPVEISFAATSLKDDVPAYGDVPGLPHGALTVVGLFGANASGKTSVLRSLHRLRDEVTSSFTARKPNASMGQQPFRLAAALADQPTTFTVEFVAEDTRYEYGLTYGKARVRQEWLYAFPTNRRRVLFVREAPSDADPATVAPRTGQDSGEDSYYFGSKLRGKSQLRQVARSTRPNATFIATCAQLNAPHFASVYDWFEKSLVFGPTADWRAPTPRFATSMPILRAETKPVVRQMLCAADFGVADFTSKPDEKMVANVERMLERDDALDADVRAQFEEIVSSPPHRISLGHTSRDGELVYLDDYLESSGTAAFLHHLNFALDVLTRGAVLIVDEIAATLHSRMVERLVQLFTDPTSNPHGAQLLFSSHDHTLLRSIRRDGVILIDKGSDGATYATPVSDFRVRKREDLIRAYEQGRFGGVPVLGSLNEVMAAFHAAQEEARHGEATD